MPGVAGLTPARFALGLSADFRTTPGLIFFYSSAGEIAVTWRIGGLVTWLWLKKIAARRRDEYLPLADFPLPQPVLWWMKSNCRETAGRGTLRPCRVMHELL